MTDIQFLARSLESFRDHCFNFGRGIPSKTRAKAGLFKTQEAWEEVSGMLIPALHSHPHESGFSSVI